MTPTAYIVHVENTLGWEAPVGEEWQRYQREARNVILRQETNPELYTWRNLMLATEYLRRRKTSRSPLGVFAYVELALAEAPVDDTELETNIRTAVARELRAGDILGWAARFARATGSYRGQAYAEYTAAHQAA